MTVRTAQHVFGDPAFLGVDAVEVKGNHGEVAFSQSWEFVGDLHES